ncbi:MAG TPA: hypothetical protein DCO83_10185 [Mucilaginibacter sp.]|jgi:hypothetical protein|nr:hypothetical protein [Mucilaginibacter sp.]
MIKSKVFVFLLMMILFFEAKSEVIDGPANFRDKPNGKVLVSLKDSVPVESGELKNGWFEVSFSVMITNQQYSSRYSLKKGTPLYDFDHKLLGITLADIPDELTTSSATGGTEGHYKWCWIDIRGYVYQSNVRKNSIPENVLDSTFKPGKFSFQYDSLKGFMKKEGYKAQGLIKKTLANCEEYCIYESIVVDQGDGYRIGLIFENNELIAIEHTRPVKVGIYKEYTTSDRTKLIIFRSPKNMSIKKFVDKINASRAGAG